MLNYTLKTITAQYLTISCYTITTINDFIDNRYIISNNLSFMRTFVSVQDSGRY